MKTRKFLLLVLTVLFAVSLVACGDENIYGSNDSADVGDTYTLASDFEFYGKCDDHMIGDNEFNPFE